MLRGFLQVYVPYTGNSLPFPSALPFIFCINRGKAVLLVGAEALLGNASYKKIKTSVSVVWCLYGWVEIRKPRLNPDYRPRTLTASLSRCLYFFLLSSPIKGYLWKPGCYACPVAGFIYTTASSDEFTEMNDDATRN